jgi:hypothetical protein
MINNYNELAREDPTPHRRNTLERGALRVGQPRYQPFYCEENAWHLCQDASFKGRQPRVVFISGAGEGVVMWGQRAQPLPGQPLLWDYHVVVLVEAPWEVWDLDTAFGSPLGAAAYLKESFPRRVPRFEPLFRLVDAEEYVRVFASDRSHMLDADGHFTREPPPWPALGPAGAPPNLARFIDPAPGFVGEVVDYAGLLRRVA